MQPPIPPTPSSIARSQTSVPETRAGRTGSSPPTRSSRRSVFPSRRLQHRGRLCRLGHGRRSRAAQPRPAAVVHEPLPAYNGRNLEYDATREVEHEIDEVLGGGGAAGTTLNDIAYYGKNNRADPFTYYEGPRSLRYSAQGKASFSTSPALSYLSVNGGKTSVVGFNQYAQGDLAESSARLPDHVRAAALAGRQLARPSFRTLSAVRIPKPVRSSPATSLGGIPDARGARLRPDRRLIQIGGVGATLAVKGAMATVFGVQDPEGFDPINGAQIVPEPATWVMTLTGFAAMAAAFRWAPRRRAARARGGQLDVGRTAGPLPSETVEIALSESVAVEPLAVRHLLVGVCAG